MDAWGHHDEVKDAPRHLSGETASFRLLNARREKSWNFAGAGGAERREPEPKKAKSLSGAADREWKLPISVRDQMRKAARVFGFCSGAPPFVTERKTRSLWLPMRCD